MIFGSLIDESICPKGSMSSRRSRSRQLVFSSKLNHPRPFEKRSTTRDEKVRIIEEDLGATKQQVRIMEGETRAVTIKAGIMEAFS
jgi:hypothetical protein